ncbi:MAG: hypothetical protein V2I82_10310 [Halieaceae bacterium]|jgi:hypothetical protein|nr:hypothetical protein [Halieaceae bacterium]
MPRPSIMPARFYGTRRLRAVLRSFLPLATAAYVSGSLALPDPKVIVNSSVEVERISLNDARLLLTARLATWPDMSPVTVFVLPDDSPLHDDFARSVLQLFPYQLRRTWDRQLFSGTGRAPTVVRSEAEMLRQVEATPGAIGYVERIPEGVDVRELIVQ